MTVTAEAAISTDGLDYVEADLTYVTDRETHEVVVTHTGKGRGESVHVGTYAPKRVRIHDARPVTDRFELEREGVRCVAHTSAVTDFYDNDELKAVYEPEIDRLIREETGAVRTVIFDHTRRSGDEAVREKLSISGPVTRAHNDYTEWSAPKRVRDLLPGDEAEELLRHRYQVVQVWRPLQDVVLSNPLAICDAQSIDESDLVRTIRRYPERVGETYHLAYDPAQRWFYFPKLTRDEALVFKCFDSMRDGRSRFTAHTAFEDPNTPAGAPPRASMESRALVFFAPGS